MQALDPNLSRSVIPPVLLSPGAGGSDPVKALGAVEERSRLLGRALARQARGNSVHPLDWVHRGGDGVGGGSPDREALGLDAPCQDLVEELVLFSNSSLPAMEKASGLACSAALASLLHWAWKGTEGWDEGVRESLLLKPLMPLYLSCGCPPQQRSRVAPPALSQSVQLAVELIALVELSRSLEHVGFSAWLKERGRADEDLSRTIRQGLQVDLFQIIKSMESLRSGWNDPSTNSWIAEQPVSEIEHRTWWSLAWQWSRGENWMFVPAGVPEAVVPWSQLTTHWKRLYGLLGGTPVESQSNVIEIRAAGDTILADKLDQWLDEVRTHQGILSLVTARYLGETPSQSGGNGPLLRWQTAWLESIGNVIEGSQPGFFLTESGDVAITYQDLDRKELAQFVRDALGPLGEALARSGLLVDGEEVPLIVGIACVDGPAKSFRIEQLHDAAGRCLENAASQGPGTIKSIEVF